MRQAWRLCVEEIAHFAFGFSKGIVQAVVYNHRVEAGGETQFVFCFGYPLLDFLGGVGASALQAFAQGFNGWGLNEEGKRLVAKLLFDVQATNDVYIKKDGFALCPDALHFAVERAVETTGVDFFVFQKFACRDAAFEFFFGEEVVFFAMLFLLLFERHTHLS